MRRKAKKQEEPVAVAAAEAEAEEPKPGRLQYSEERLSRLIGYERDELRARRGALADGHWGRALGHIAYDKHAVLLMMKTFGLTPKDAGLTQAELLERVVIDKPKVADTEIKVMRLGKNRGLLAGIRLEDEQRVTVRVRDNALFVPGMVLDCAMIREGQYEYLGRLPRSRGRW